jgi:hypothetical protein
VPARAKGKAEPEVDRKAIMDEILAFAKTVKLPRRLSVRELKRMAAEGRD